MGDDDNEIDNLLKALDGIEQCFVTDSKDSELERAKDVKKSPSSIKVVPSVSANKRPVDAPISLAPPCKKINLNLKDPRLRKLSAGTTSVKERNGTTIREFDFLNSRIDTSPAPTHVTDAQRTSRSSLRTSVKFHNDDSKSNKEFQQNIQSNEDTSQLLNKSTSSRLTEVSVKKSNTESIKEPIPRSLTVSHKPDKSSDNIRFTPITKREPENVSLRDVKPKIQDKLSNSNESLNESGRNKIETIPFRKPEKIANLPIRRPVRPLNNLSKDSLPPPNKGLIDKKSQNFPRTKPSTIRKSVPSKNSNLGKVPTPLVEKLSKSQKSTEITGNSGQPVSISTNKCNENKVMKAIPRSSILPEKLQNINEPKLVREKRDVLKELDSKNNKAELPASRDGAQTMKNGPKNSVNKPTKERKVHIANSLLPLEMLIKIFQYLSVRDRRNAKLVCKCWYDTCSMKLFMMHQRFVCCGNYATTTILQILMESRCEYLNVEFYRVNFLDNFTECWKVLGPKIHSLYFVDCVIGEQTFGDVIINCTEMEHMSLSFEYLKVPPIRLFSLTLFENLYKQRIERRKVVSFDLQINSNGWFCNAIISNLFAIFPHISRLGFTCHSLDPIENEKEAVPPSDIAFSDLWSSKTLTFSPILKCILSPPDSMEKLILSLHTKGRRTGFAWESIVTHSALTRLREITIEIDLKKLSGNAVVEFCCKQKELKRISCKIVGSAKLFISLFLMKLLESCPRLRNLDVSYNAPFLISYELFRGLINSKLKSLSLESSNVLLAPQIVEESTWPINEHLQSLSLSPNVGKNLQNLLIVIFCNLKFLEIHDLTDDVLQLIWKFQTNLIGLKLAGVDECTIDGFCGVPENLSFSIRNLRNLEYLVLEAVNQWQIYGNVFSEFHFPKMRYFCVDIEGSTTLYHDLIDAMKLYSELEAVSINFSGIERSTWLGLNKNWKKLRYLRIVDKESDKFKKNQYLKFFKTSPNLRALVHEFKTSTESYYYDIIEKKIQRKVYRAKYRISSEKVGSSFIDWLWF